MADRLKSFSLNATQLKLIAVVSMTVDHVGYFLFPDVSALRAIGRLAFPIFAYLIAEGCEHTRSIGRYFGRIFVFAAACQAVYLVSQGSVEMGVLVTFCMSVAVIAAVRFAKNSDSRFAALVPAAAVGAAYFICEILPDLLKESDFSVEYGFAGVILPVLVYLAPDRSGKIAALSAGIALYCAFYHSSWRFFAFAAIIPMLLYNGERGGRGGRFDKYFFYFYYPLHLAAIWGIKQLIDRF